MNIRLQISLTLDQCFTNSLNYIKCTCVNFVKHMSDMFPLPQYPFFVTCFVLPSSQLRPKCVAAKMIKTIDCFFSSMCSIGYLPLFRYKSSACLPVFCNYTHQYRLSTFMLPNLIIENTIFHFLFDLFSFFQLLFMLYLSILQCFIFFLFLIVITTIQGILSQC